MTAVRPFVVEAFDEMGDVLMPWMSRVAPFLQSTENTQIACCLVRLAGDDYLDGHVTLLTGGRLTKPMDDGRKTTGLPMVARKPYCREGPESELVHDLLSAIMEPVVQENRMEPAGTVLAQVFGGDADLVVPRVDHFLG